MSFHVFHMGNCLKLQEFLGNKNILTVTVSLDKYNWSLYGLTLKTHVELDSSFYYKRLSYFFVIDLLGIFFSYFTLKEFLMGQKGVII